MKEHNLSLCLNRSCLTESSTDNLVRLARFLECPVWAHLEEGPRRNNLVNAIMRVEKCMKLGRQHPFKTIYLKDK